MVGKGCEVKVFRKWGRPFGIFERMVYVINLILAFFIIRYEHNSGSDKTIIVTSVLYVILVIANLVLGFATGMDGRRVSRSFYRSALGLVALVLIYMVWVVMMPASAN
jgi:hypothetical protein